MGDQASRLSALIGAEPIVALATAPGRGAIGVVRVSGKDISALRDAILRRTTQARHATYGPFLDAAGEPIDHGLAIFFPAPNSYTGEEVLELQAHGGPVVLRLLVHRLLELGQSMGLRLARPGEFTERAFLNGKMDLAQAEAVADLIDAQSTQAARLASRSLAGDFSRLIDSLLAKLIRLRMLVEATLDFPEEEVDELARGDAAGQLLAVRNSLAEVLRQAEVGARLREGMTVVIAGEPNVGKSSLLNALAGDSVAIVTPVAGTTRDRIRESLLIDGMPLNVVDTAGLRETDDAVEVIGVEMSRTEIKRADLVMRVISAVGSGQVQEQVDALAIARDAGVPVLTVVNKIDLVSEDRQVFTDKTLATGEAVFISALNGTGLAALKEKLLTIFGWQQVSEAQFIARDRHLQALAATAEHLALAEPLLTEGLELFAEELRLAQESLGSITGAMTADDLLGEIFSSFCIGK